MTHGYSGINTGKRIARRLRQRQRKQQYKLILKLDRYTSLRLLAGVSVADGYMRFYA